MLNLFNSFVVPGVEYVTIYHDDQDDHLFYMLPEYPSITKASDGGPMFSLIVFARDFHLMKDAAAQLASTETEGGLIQMTTELSVSEEDQAKIRDYIQNQLQGVRPVYAGPASIGFAPVRGITGPIRLSYPTWVDGKVSFCLIPAAGDTFLKAQGGSDKPSLIATNLANYVAVLGQEGEILFRDAAANGRTPGSVNYSVSFVARIPSLTIHVWGNMSDIYQDLKKQCTVTPMYSRIYYRLAGILAIAPAMQEIALAAAATGATGTATSASNEPSNLDTLRKTFASLHIEVDSGDWQSGVTDSNMAQDVEKKLNDMVFEVVQDYLKSKFFGATFNPGLQSDQAGDGGTGTTGGDGSSVPGGNQSWLKVPSEGLEGQLDFQVTYRSNVVITKNPNRLLFEILTAEQVKQRIIEADLSDPLFQFLDVPVMITADFTNDPIAAIYVQPEYNQRDDITGEEKKTTMDPPCVFKTGQEVFRFYVRMVKDQNGVPKDTYAYSSQINYKMSSEPVKIPAKETRDRALIIGYNQLSCVRVQAIWGGIPTDTIKQVKIHFRYPNLNLPTAEKDVTLSPDHTSDSWFTYTGGNPSVEYEYQLSYLLVGDQRLDLPVQHGSSNTLVVNAPFVDTLRATFVSQGSFPPVSAIVVSTRYSDPDFGYIVEDEYTFSSPASTWKWEVRLLNKAKRGFEYKVDVTYTNGPTDQGSWLAGVEGAILVGQVTPEILEIDVIPSLLDMQRVWKLVVVRLSYSDPGNQISQDQIFQITAANAAQTMIWKVPLKNPAVRKYTYQIEAFGFDNTKNKVVGPTDTEDRLLVLQL